MKIRTRFAPSPTGYLHIGGLRTALYAFLLAKRLKGEFLLRIEDTDRERFVPGADVSLMRVLKEMGLEWDKVKESVIGNQESGVVYQSKRLDVYKKFAEKLIEEHKAFYCFCSKERLDDLRARQTAQKLPTGYDGLCQNLIVEEINEKKKNITPVVRLKMPKTGACCFHDAIRGNIEFSYAGQEDVILMKSDGFPTYHLAHVIDDNEMKITHVIRGEEWLPTIPKHLALWEALGWEKPIYAHLPLIVNPDKTKLSKRQGHVAVEDYLNKGYLKDALLNFILLLGWNPGTEKEIFSMEEMIQEFSMEKIHKSSAVFNTEKLDWINGFYIRKTPLNLLVEMCVPYLQEKDLIGERYDKKYLEKIVLLEQERLKKLSELPELTDYFFKDTVYDKNLLLWKNQTLQEVATILENLLKKIETITDINFNKNYLEKEILAYVKECNLKNGDVLWPFRVAMTGKKASPGPFEVADALGKEKVIQKIKNAILQVR